jgi:hypothetical protein
MEERQMASKYRKKCSILPTIKELQIKTTLRFHLNPFRMAIFKGNNHKNAGKDVVNQESLFPVVENANLCYHYRNQ